MTIVRLPADLLLYINEYNEFHGQVMLAVCSRNMTTDLLSYSSPLATRLSHFHAQRPFYKKLSSWFGTYRWFYINRSGYIWTAPILPGLYWTTSINNVVKLTHNDNSKIVNIYYSDAEQNIMIKPVVFNSIKDAHMAIIRFGENVWSRQISSTKN